ncbi:MULTISPECIES: 3-phosphoserine/phosphohydroxythreonine transaminase [Cellulophaga]|uniref:Phosphoserine aminotransferase n=2 Tax=Cellulophaga TaxID=104264 RepID=F0RCS5_CELLC|nr:MULTISPECIES: 3-phosphoserine/phosphohydroxythreonine transaminase [Cellulophaga]ADY30807.1 Phosphoserine aminotransferase [Cellulophaga lytica DSM 7489]AIM61787.1 MFS transporter [Cellulophaga lytica]APU11704.1 3-phosphoserine/phosphohydroxythreonine aminotransferase [Cellulophaga lytica]EWH12427.1 3-phosphoserine/phosphohydroxythreonine aminotransferase [Cellulophaga geojensis KL-A]MDO6852693.1 3-phosphoserine/phosphohydroxythreonine transaminase [Cellulophaga lytica]
MKKHNFSAGPCILPQEVLLKASEAVVDFNGSGLSLIEISHRSKDFVTVMETAQSLALEHLGLTDKGYKALFLQGGASMQFLMTAYNLLETKAGYLNTGTWSDKAIKEAKMFGEIVEVRSSKDKNYNYIPKNYMVPADLDYFHLTSNNTIFGTQIKEFPKTKVPVVCDMSSDIFSRKLDFSQFDLIYAGAQKNMGPAGTTLVVIKEDVLGKVTRQIPSMLNYQVHISKDSMFNTPPVFAVYTSMLTMQWLKDLGGIEAIEEINDKKAQLLYSEIDLNPLFKGFAEKADRSNMNATFNLTDEKLKETFDTMCKEAGINGINGHRSVGGYRASMYNALSLDSVGTLVDVMSDLERKA